MLAIYVLYDSHSSTKKHKVTYIIKNLDIYVVDTILLNTYFQIKLLII